MVTKVVGWAFGTVIGSGISMLRVLCCRNMRGLVIIIFSSKAILTACPLVLESKSSFCSAYRRSYFLYFTPKY